MAEVRTNQTPSRLEAMKSIGVHEADTKLGEVPGDVQRGAPVAQLLPSHPRRSVDGVAPALEALRQGKRFNGSVIAAKAFGRR